MPHAEFCWFVVGCFATFLTLVCLGAAVVLGYERGQKLGREQAEIERLKERK